MVNEPATTAKADRRERPRDNVGPSPALGVANLNPFGDLHTMQHLSARLARSLRGVFEPLLRAETRVWAEPLVVQRFADYRAERPERSEEQTSELQSLMRISYAVFCLKKKKTQH